MSITGDKIQEIMSKWGGGPLDPEHEKALDKVTELKGDAIGKAVAVTTLKDQYPEPTAYQLVMIAMAESESEAAENELKKAEASLDVFRKKIDSLTSFTE
jgi:hypothetical protein